MIDWPEAAKQGSLYAAGINVVLLGALLLTRRWWSFGGQAGPAPPAAALAAGDAVPRPLAEAGAARAAGVKPRVFWSLLAVILVVAAGLRVPLNGSSLWWDEVWQARNATVGEWRPDKKNPGQLRFRETTFAQALWNYRKPANHPPMAVASKLCHETWKKLTGAKPGAFDERVLRLPGFAASLAGIALAALLLRAWGLPGAGLIAAFFLTLHPWHIRYGIDNRGYSFLVPLTLIGLWALWRACGPRPVAFQATSEKPLDAIDEPEAVDGGPSLMTGGGDPDRTVAFQATRANGRGPGPDWTGGQDGHTTGWSWWLFGFAQALILWSHLLSVWVCLALCATGVWWIWRQHEGADRWRRLARLVAVQVAGAMLFFQLFLPNLLQATRWGEKNQDGRLLDGTVLVDTLTQVAVGHSQVWGTVLVWVLALVGVIFAMHRKLPGTAAMAALLGAGFLFLAGIWAAEFYFYPRFLFAIVAPLALAIGIAVWTLGCRELGASGRTRALAVGAVMAGLLGGGFGDGLRPVVTSGFSPLREAAAVLRDGEAGGAHVFGYGFGAEALQYYLPTLPYAREADAPEALAAALEKARAAGRPLFVATGYEALNRLALPQGFTLLDDASHASVIWSAHGLEPQFAYRIWRIN
jgi:hypothetical protein